MRAEADSIGQCDSFFQAEPSVIAGRRQNIAKREVTLFIVASREIWVLEKPWTFIIKGRQMENALLTSPTQTKTMTVLSAHMVKR